VNASSSPVQRRRLRTELRARRMDIGYTQDQVAQSMEWSLSKVIRIESGAVGISANDLRALLSLYRVTDRSLTEELLDLARASRQRTRWSGYRAEISPRYLQCIEYEQAASLLCIYEPLLLPGLFQTEEYATAIIRQLADPGTSEDVIDTRIEIRMKRQEVLEQDPPTIFCVLDEAAVQRMVGERDVAPAQIARLVDMANSPNVTLEIVPFTAGFHRGMLRPFLILEFPDPGERDVLFSESSRDTIFSHDEAGEITVFREVFEDLRSISLGAAGTLAYLRNLVTGITQIQKFQKGLHCA
jgi:transcriptional regulator with XRE-family HTH domain